MEILQPVISFSRQNFSKFSKSKFFSPICVAKHAKLALEKNLRLSISKITHSSKQPNAKIVQSQKQPNSKTAQTKTSQIQKLSNPKTANPKTTQSRNHPIRKLPNPETTQFPKSPTHKMQTGCIKTQLYSFCHKACSQPHKGDVMKKIKTTGISNTKLKDSSSKIIFQIMNYVVSS